MKALIITPTNERSVVEFGGDGPSLTNVLDDLLGHAWEAVSLRVDPAQGCDMWLDEEGKFKRLPQNHVATSMFVRSHGLHGDFIVGTVIITGGVDSDGATLGLTDEQLERLSFFTDGVEAVMVNDHVMYR